MLLQGGFFHSPPFLVCSTLLPRVNLAVVGCLPARPAIGPSTPHLRWLVLHPCPLTRAARLLTRPLPAYISRARVEAFTLASDMRYIAQNMGRIARALFEIALHKGWASLADQTLAVCTAVERRCWWPPLQHPLRQLTGGAQGSFTIFRLLLVFLVVVWLLLLGR